MALQCFAKFFFFSSKAVQSRWDGCTMFMLHLLASTIARALATYLPSGRHTPIAPRLELWQLGPQKLLNLWIALLEGGERLAGE